MLIENIYLLIILGMVFTILSIIKNEEQSMSAIFSLLAAVFLFVVSPGAVNPESNICTANSSGVISCTLMSLPGETYLAPLWFGIAILNLLFVFVILMDNFGRKGEF